MTYLWEITEAIRSDTDTLKRQLRANASGQTATGCISADACRFALILRGEMPDPYRRIKEALR